MNQWPTLLLAGLLAGAALPSAAGPPDLADDPRLARPVTLRVIRRPLSVIATELGRQAGVTLRIAPEVADEPALLVATDQSVREVMRQLALLFNYRWRRQGEPGACTYELYQDQASREEEAALRLQRPQRALAAVQAALRQRIELARRPDHKAALPPHLANRYWLHEARDPFRRALLDVSAQLKDAQWQALLSGETLSFSTRPEPGSLPLPPAVAGALRQAQPWRLPPGFPAPGVELEEEASQREAEQQDQAEWAQAEGVRIGLQLMLPSGAGEPDAVLTVRPTALMPDDHPGNPPFLPILVVAGQGDPAGNASLSPASGDAPAEAAGQGRASSNDPILGIKRRFQVSRASLGTSKPASEGASEAAKAGVGQFGSFHHLLLAIADAYGLNLVADGYRPGTLPMPALPAGEEWALDELLNRFVLPSAGWSRVDAFLQVRRHTWYEDRLAEIPERIVRHWSERLQRTRSSFLEDAAALVLSLSDAQLHQFEAVMREDGLRVHLAFAEGDDPGTRRERAILRAFGSLMPGQRRRLQEGGWIHAAAMPPEARHWLRAALAARSGDPMDTLDPMAAPPPGEAAGGVLSLGAPPRPVEEENESAPVPVPSRATAASLLTEVIFRYQMPGTKPDVMVVRLPRIAPAGATGGRE